MTNKYLAETRPASPAKPVTIKNGAGLERYLTPKEASDALRVSTSWLAKSRMKGDGPPFIKVGRAVRYAEAGLLHWMRGRQRLSTSQQ